MVYTLVSRSFVVNFKFTSLIYFCAINHVRIFGLCVYATCGGLRFLLPSLIRQGESKLSLNPFGLFEKFKENYSGAKGE
jgi:hypothetical protein